jgi:hypothetical protein
VLSLLCPASNNTIGDGYCIGVGCGVNEGYVGGDSASQLEISANRCYDICVESQDIGECQRVGIGINHAAIGIKCQNSINQKEVGWPLYNTITIHHDGAEVGLTVGQARKKEEDGDK